MKKILPFVLALILIVVLISGHYVYKSFSKEKLQENNSVSDKEQIIEDEPIKDDIPIVEEEIKENDISSQDNNSLYNNDKQNIPSNNSHSQVNNNNTHVPIVEEETPKTEENTTPTIEDKPSDVIIPPQVDEELERLKKLCPYTSQSCMDASIDVSLNNTSDPNFKHTACESMAYKGQLVGFCMLIYYNDNTWKYYETAN